MKFKWSILVCLLVAVSVAMGCAPAMTPSSEVPSEYRSLRIVAGSIGSGGTTAMMSLALLFNRYYPEIQWSSSTGASTVNTVYIIKGTQKLGLTLAGAYIDAYGLDKIAESRIRTISPTRGPTVYPFLIPADKPWKDISEVPKGSTVAPGQAGTAQLKASEAWLSLAGLTPKDFRWVTMGHTEISDAWRQGKLDVVSLGVAGPQPALLDMYTSPRKFKIIGLSPEQLAKARAEQTFERVGYTLSQKEANLTQLVPDVFTYNVFAPQVLSFLGSRDDFPDEIAYKMAKVLDERHAEAVQIYSPLKDLSVQLHIENAKPPMEIHPGVAKYYKEKGYLK